MAEPADPLREWFDRIDAAELAGMKDRREEEGLNLDFKRMDPSGEPSDDDKRNLRKAVSGFANAAGGVILWGVESKSGTMKGDHSRFQDYAPVKDGERAAVRLHELTGVATQIPVSGVVHRSIAVPGGFVVKTFVPASDGGPHRTNEELGQYYRRDADAFRAMQHHEVADMFGRRARPQLKLWVQEAFNDPWLRMSGVRCVRIIGLENVGRGIARFPSLVLKVSPDGVPFGDYRLDDTGASGLPFKRTVETSVPTRFYAGGDNDVIHPGQVLQVTRIGMPQQDMGLCIVDYQVFAEGMKAVEGRFRFAPQPGAFKFD